VKWLVDKFVDWLLDVKQDKPEPTKEEIADLIDRHLGTTDGAEDGKIIRHENNYYHYYITRSPKKKRRN
jgi:hypothetical protein